MLWTEAAFYPPDISRLCEVAIQDVLKNPGERLPRTGLVFAGFGDAEIFPSMLEYQSCGVVQGRHISLPGLTERIDHETPASLSAFAQTSMSDTFTLGLSFDAFNSLTVALDTGLRRFAGDLFKAASISPPPSVPTLDQLIANTTNAITDHVMQNARVEHAFPLRRVLGVLPIDEMANLAETLIALQSLKEKVTKPSETVGGPVDVAVITRSEGLVWVKRKHFFDPSLNSRYLQRQGTVYS